MLPKPHKLTNSAEFKKTIRNGKRAGRSTVVVYVQKLVAPAKDSDALHLKTRDIAQYGGPQCGLVVSKAVGNAVTRHRLSRQFRHILMKVIAELPEAGVADPSLLRIVVRALPPAASATHAELESDVRDAVFKAYGKYDKANEN